MNETESDILAFMGVHEEEMARQRRARLVVVLDHWMTKMRRKAWMHTTTAIVLPR